MAACAHSTAPSPVSAVLSGVFFIKVVGLLWTD
jgi:formate hydrogenlyase subunit 3/multisubunit Na+/H+ antiporter MnhD subunit